MQSEQEKKMIDQTTVQKILDTANVVEVIEDFITLKKRGANYLGNCPFHNEKTPSFSVSPAKGIFKCFGCGEAGTAVGFVMKHENISYPEALKYLAKKYNIQVVEKEQSKEEKQLHQDKDSMLVVSTFANKFYMNALFEHDEGLKIGLSYLKERGFRTDVIKKFQLGYHPDQKTILTDAALKNGYKLEFLEKTGLTIVRDNWKIDRFLGRVMFPIHSISGNVIAFGGRTLKNDKKIAKYLNSPESDIYHKSNILYGIYFAKKEIVQQDKCYMVEGYTDVISMHQAGIENVVASSGTSLTVQQIQLVKRFTPNLTIIYDGDAAGIKASLRGIDLILEEELNVKIVLLPDDEDPDSFSKKLSPREFIAYVTENEEDFIKFKTHLLMEEAENDPIKRANMITDIVRSISKIPDAIKRSMYIKECSTLLDVKEDALYGEIAKILRRKKEEQFRKNRFNLQQNVNDTSNKLPSFVENIYSEVAEKEIIYFLLNFGDKELETIENEETGESQKLNVSTFIIAEILNENLELKNLIYKKIFEEYKQILFNGDEVDVSKFMNHEDDKIRELASDMLTSKYIPSKIWEKQGSFVETPDKTFKKDIPKAINTYKFKIINQAIKETTNELKNVSELSEIKDIMDRKIELEAIQKILAKALERTII